MVVHLNQRATLTIPLETRKELGIEPGDTLEIQVQKGKMILTPVSIIPKTLGLTEKGTIKEGVANREIREGKVKNFDSIRDLLKDLTL